MNAFDICCCGDYRKDHRIDGVCEPCRYARKTLHGNHPCEAFTLAHAIETDSLEEAEHVRFHWHLTQHTALEELEG